jgi:glycosyltransferase involved in cell wall biosynthesis
MKNNSLVSVVVPVYNIKNYIEKCLESIISQSYENLEIVVVDDGSTDESGRLCDEFAKKDKRVKVFHKKNGGLSDARNFGIKKSQGEIVALVDGDDYVDADYIKAMYEVMVKDDSDIVVCGFDNIIPSSFVVSGEEATKKLLVEQENIEIVAWNKLYKKELFEKGIEYPVGDKHEDALTTYKLFAEAKKVSYVSKSLYHYVKREDSIMGQKDIVGRLEMRKKAAKEAVEYFADNSQLKQAAEVAVLTARYAFMDAAIHGEINKKYFAPNAKWVDENRKKYQNNKLMTKKLKLYNSLNHLKLYKVFRTIV